MSDHDIDKDIELLIVELCDIAGAYRGAMRQNEKASAQEYMREYHECMEQLYELGWDPSKRGSSHFDVTCGLPDDLMPKRYLEDVKVYQQHIQHLYDTGELVPPQVFYSREYQKKHYPSQFEKTIDSLIGKVKRWLEKR